MIDKLLIDTDHKFACIDVYEIGDLDHTILWNCQRLGDDVLRNVLLILSESRPLPDVIGNPLSWLICSERLAKMIKSADPDGIQILECRIEDPLGKKLEGHFVINILNCLDAINLKESDYEEEDGDIDMVRPQGAAISESPLPPAALPASPKNP